MFRQSQHGSLYAVCHGRITSFGGTSGTVSTVLPGGLQEEAYLHRDYVFPQLPPCLNLCVGLEVQYEHHRPYTGGQPYAYNVRVLTPLPWAPAPQQYRPAPAPAPMAVPGAATNPNSVMPAARSSQPHPQSQSHWQGIGMRSLPGTVVAPAPVLGQAPTPAAARADGRGMAVAVAGLAARGSSSGDRMGPGAGGVPAAHLLPMWPPSGPDSTRYGAENKPARACAQSAALGAASSATWAANSVQPLQQLSSSRNGGSVQAGASTGAVPGAAVVGVSLPPPRQLASLPPLPSSPISAAAAAIAGSKAQNLGEGRRAAAVIRVCAQPVSARIGGLSNSTSGSNGGQSGKDSAGWSLPGPAAVLTATQQPQQRGWWPTAGEWSARNASGNAAGCIAGGEGENIQHRQPPLPRAVVRPPAAQPVRTAGSQGVQPPLPPSLPPALPPPLPPSLPPHPPPPLSPLQPPLPPGSPTQEPSAPPPPPLPLPPPPPPPPQCLQRSSWLPSHCQPLPPPSSATWAAAAAVVPAVRGTAGDIANAQRPGPSSSRCVDAPATAAAGVFSRTAWGGGASSGGSGNRTGSWCGAGGAAVKQPPLHQQHQPHTSSLRPALPAYSRPRGGMPRPLDDEDLKEEGEWRPRDSTGPSRQEEDRYAHHNSTLSSYSHYDVRDRWEGSRQRDCVSTAHTGRDRSRERSHDRRPHRLSPRGQREIPRRGARYSPQRSNPTTITARDDHRGRSPPRSPRHGPHYSREVQVQRLDAVQGRHRVGIAVARQDGRRRVVAAAAVIAAAAQLRRRRRSSVAPGATASQLQSSATATVLSSGDRNSGSSEDSDHNDGGDGTGRGAEAGQDDGVAARASAADAAVKAACQRASDVRGSGGSDSTPHLLPPPPPLPAPPLVSSWARHVARARSRGGSSSGSTATAWRVGATAAAAAEDLERALSRVSLSETPVAGAVTMRLFCGHCGKEQVWDVGGERAKPLPDPTAPDGIKRTREGGRVLYDARGSSCGHCGNLAMTNPLSAVCIYCDAVQAGFRPTFWKCSNSDGAARRRVMTGAALSAAAAKTGSGAGCGKKAPEQEPDKDKPKGGLAGSEAGGAAAPQAAAVPCDYSRTCSLCAHYDLRYGGKPKCRCPRFHGAIAGQVAGNKAGNLGWVMVH